MPGNEQTAEEVRAKVFAGTVAIIRQVIQNLNESDDKTRLYEYMTRMSTDYPQYTKSIDEAAQQYLSTQTYKSWQQYMLLM
jgi:carbamoylphosphate synthase large subunit